MATGRPRFKDEDLKYKRPPEGYKRKSNHVSQQLDIPEPSENEKAKWSALARLCWERVISNPSSHEAAKKNMIDIVWASLASIPESFPRGRNSKKVVASGIAKRYNSEAVLMWLWERKLTKYSVSELYRMRTEAWMAAIGGLNIEVGMLGSYNVEKMFEEFS
jgi:hypothetical protein